MSVDGIYAGESQQSGYFEVRPSNSKADLWIWACVGRNKTCSPSSGVPSFKNSFCTLLQCWMDTRRAAKINAELQEKMCWDEDESTTVWLAKQETGYYECTPSKASWQEKSWWNLRARESKPWREARQSKLTSYIESLKESCKKLGDKLIGVKNTVGG